MVLKAKPTRKTRKVTLEKASASEIISALRITRAEQRRAKAAVATAARMIRRGSNGEKKRVSGNVARMRKADGVK